MLKLKINLGLLVVSGLWIASEAGGAEATVPGYSLENLPVVCRRVETVKGAAPSLLPEGKAFKLVWHDEFDGTALDWTKWSYRTNFWGRVAHWFASPEDGCVEVKDGFLRLMVKRRPDGQFISPQLQTGEIMWDVPPMDNPQGFWWLGGRNPPKFLHRYGYYECRCRLQQMPGWWSAFWMQTEMQGCCLDAARAGVEHDIMESFEPGVIIPSVFHYDGYGEEYKCFTCPRRTDGSPEAVAKVSSALDKTQFHVFGLLWEPDGYTLYVDGKRRGEKVGRGPGENVSQTDEFILISTEVKWYRNNRMTGTGVPELAAAVAAEDDFVVDYVRVYDIQ